MTASMPSKAVRHRKLLQFRKLFWRARQSVRKRGTESKATDQAYSRALAFARENRLNVESLLDATLLDAQQKPSEALRVLDESAGVIPAELKGYFHHVRAAILLDIERYNEALDEVSKAIASKYFDAPAYALHNRALILSGMERRDEAIEAYRQSLGTPGYDSRGDGWNNIGNLYDEKGDYELAISAYKKALKSRGYDTPAVTLANLGYTYLRSGKPKEALKAFRAALRNPDVVGNIHARARAGISLVQAQLSFSALSPDDLALSVTATAPTLVDSTESPEPSLISKIKEAGDTQYDKYLKRPSSERDDTLSILRGWSSAVTLMEGSERRWRGGGYFLKWRGCGIVVDPGFDFLRNLHDARYHGREIKAVVVTHNHPDHNSDLKPIDDLRYELYRRRTEDIYGAVTPYVLFVDQDTQTATKFGYEAPEHHYDPIIMPSGFPQMIDVSKHPANLPFRVIPFKVNHGADVPHAMGFVIELLDKRNRCACRLGYTGDTEYFPDLPTHLSECDVLIAHISQPGIDELLEEKKIKSQHLGYRGMIRLLQESKPKLALIGEFWAGFTDLRIDLVKALRLRSAFAAILPAGLGLHVGLAALEIHCTQCQKPTRYDDIRVSPPSDRFGDLSYLCPACLLS